MAFLRWMSLASIAAKIVLKHPEGCEVAHISRKFLDPLTRGAACKAEIPDAMLLLIAARKAAPRRQLGPIAQYTLD
jgi:hypothetical protein